MADKFRVVKKGSKYYIQKENEAGVWGGVKGLFFKLKCNDLPTAIAVAKRLVDTQAAKTTICGQTSNMVKPACQPKTKRIKDHGN